uniref:Uncharacterized protein n=1 Tax=Chlamydomonas euryale TaxID=1486919 RepID=A0A7R9W1G0_9CHLO|mmetsp:Transcript_8893/g.26990  ORF Transcript_8893/g.26990 Transcript_8893/m.26990 type:complete len:192 (+) Transcript_8893:361-936(+)
MDRTLVRTRKVRRAANYACMHAHAFVHADQQHCAHDSMHTFRCPCLQLSHVCADYDSYWKVETFKLIGTGSKVKLTTFDMSGHQKYRMLWDSFYADAQGVMFVVDASCAEFDETKSTLHEVLGKTRPKIPVLILANKSDVQGAHKPEELKDKLSVGTGSGRTTAVLSCCGIKNEGLQESMEWLLKSIRSSL